MIEDIEEGVGSNAIGARIDVPGLGSDTDTIPVISIGDGASRPPSDAPSFDAWEMLRSEYMGGLAFQGLEPEYDEPWDETSLASMNPLETFGIPQFAGESLPARLAEQPSSSSAGVSSNGIRLMSETLEQETPKFFWETDPFLQTVFGTQSSAEMVFGKPNSKRPVDGIVDVDTIEEETPIMQALKRRLEKPIPLHARVLKHVEETDSKTKRTSLFSDWSTLIAIDVGAFAMSNMLKDEGISRGGVIDAVASCLGPKATSTIHKRYCALSRFVKWALQSGRQVFPLRESVAYAYLVDLRENPKTAPTAGQSFVESIHFAGTMLGMQHDLDLVGDQRIKGVAEELARSGGAMQQAEALTVDQVKRLEALTCVADCLADTLTLGGLLIMVYGCARHSDLQRARRVIWDVDENRFNPTSLEPQGYLEFQVLCHKTARSVKMKRTFLPVVCPLVSLSAEPWYVAWYQARKALGMGVEGDVEFPILCRFDSNGNPVKQEMTSAEAGAILREALRIDSSPPHKVRSHSLKCTCLSWASKGGLDLPTRRILGHHLDPGAKAAEIYGRDTIAPAVRKLTDLLGWIKEGRFSPDSTRSGRFKKIMDVPEDAASKLCGANDAEPSSESESSSSTSEASDTDPEAEEGYGSNRALTSMAFVDLRPSFEEMPEKFRTWRHKTSGVQHLQDEDGEKFLCGRRVTDRYTLTDQKPLVEVAICQQCMKTKSANDAQMAQGISLTEQFDFFL